MVKATYANVVANSGHIASTSGNQGDFYVDGEGDDDENVIKTPNTDEIAVTSNLHPLFLANIDHPGLILISKKLTGTDNFGPWKRSITIALSAKNKLGIVDGSVPRPVEASPLRNQWDRVNDMVISWIMNTVTDEISNGMDFVNSAKEMWEELHDQFASVNGHRVYQVLKDLHALEQSDKSVEIYYHKMKNLWDEYVALEPTIPCTCGSNRLTKAREQRKKLLQFLMGLNDSFSNARGQILMMNPLPSTPQAYSLVKQEEKQRIGHNVNLTMSFMANSNNTKAPKTVSDTSTQSAGAKKPALKCTFCQKEGHLRENCFKIIGYPPKGKGRGKPNAPNAATAPGFRTFPQAMHVGTINNPQTQTPPVAYPPVNTSVEQLQQQVTHMSHLMSLMMQQNQTQGNTLNTPENHIQGIAGLAFSMLTSNPMLSKGTWIIDTGASHHMCYDRLLMHDIHPIAHSFHVALPNNHVILVTHVGSVRLGSQLVLHEVLLVPDFKCNLLSISKLTSELHCKVVFTHDSCVFQDQNQVTLATGLEKEGLYFFFLQSPSSVSVSSANSAVSYCFNSSFTCCQFIQALAYAFRTFF